MRSQCGWRLYLLAVLALLASAARRPVGAAGSAGIVTTATGQLKIRHGGGASFAALTRGGSFAVGDIVSTGPDGKATLLFSDGSHVRLNANTAIQITPPARVGNGHQSLFRAVGGEVWARLRQGKAIQTRTAIAGVRGTEVDLKVAEDGTSTLSVIEGEVDFSNEFGAVLVEQSQQSVARPGAAPTAPVTINNGGFIIEWTNDLNRAVIPRERFYISLDRARVAAELPRRASVVQAAPEDAEAHRAYGDALYDNRQYVAALAEYQSANRLQPRQPATLTRVGYTLIELDRLDDASASFHAALGPAVQTASLQPVALSSARQVQASDAPYTPALVGLAWVALSFDNPEHAQTFAEQAVSAGSGPQVHVAALQDGDADEAGDAVQANVALGLSLMRQPGKIDDSVQAFQNATKLQPAAYRYQARAWLSLVYQSQGDPVSALREGQAAVQAEPHSSLAHGNLSLVYFYAGKAQQAVREGRQAAQLNPNSVAARVALGQSLLASGDVDIAADQAAQAVALDPHLPQAQYLLGVADADRRDYVHATRVLQESLRLAPNFLPAASVLARVYTRMGQPKEAVALLTDLAPRYPRGNEVQAALGEVYYEQGRYEDAANQYRKAIAGKPNSALYYAGLARTLLDSNRLSDALDAARQAVQLAPEVAQYHAILGQAYDFSRISAQSEREYRTALTLDPQNALARAMLGLKATDPTTTVDTFSQAFLFDPAVAQQVMRGGINTEAAPSTGNDGQRNIGLLHRDTTSAGKLNFLGGLGDSRDRGDGRANDGTHSFNFRQDTTYLLGPKTNLYFNLGHANSRQGLASLASSPSGVDPDANSKFGFDQGEFALRHRLRAGNYLWLGLTYQRLTTDLFNGALPLPLPFPLPIGVAFPYTNQNFRNRALIPEIRADFSLSRAPEHATVLTVGAAHANLRPSLVTGPLALVLVPKSSAPIVFPAPLVFPASTSNGNEGFSALYSQVARKMNDRLSLVAQLRAQRDDTTTTTIGGLNGFGVASTVSTRESHLLPSLMSTYQLNPKTTLRLLLNERAGSTNLAFAPTETRLTVEPDILFRGSFRKARILEVDGERYLPNHGFLKVFLFRAVGNDVALGTDAQVYAFRINAPFTLGRLNQTGAGLRYEQPLTRYLYGMVNLVVSRTNNFTPGQAFNLGQAPYYPNRTATAALNYVDPHGNKVALLANYFGSFFQDRPSFFGLPTAAGRPTFPSHTYVTLLFAREASVHNEIFIGFTNLFNAPSITFNDAPTISDAFGTGRRRFIFGVTRRY